MIILTVFTQLVMIGILLFFLFLAKRAQHGQAQHHYNSNNWEYVEMLGAMNRMRHWMV